MTVRRVTQPTTPIINASLPFNSGLGYYLDFSMGSGMPVSKRETNMSYRYMVQESGGGAWAPGGYRVNDGGVGYASLNANASPNLNTDNWSIYVYLTIHSVTGSYAGIINRRTSGSTNGMWQLNRNNATSGINFAYRAGSFVSVTFANGWPGTGTHQIVLTRQAVSPYYSYYLNGNLVDTDTTSSVPAFNSSQELSLGVLGIDNTGNRVDATFHAVGVWITRTLSAPDVQRLYKNPFLVTSRKFKRFFFLDTTSQTITPTGISSAEAFGSATVTGGSALVEPSSIASGEAFGSASLSTGAVTVAPLSVASAEAFGSHTLTTGAVSITPSGIASAEAFGTQTLTTGAVSITPSGIATAEAFGSHTVSGGLTLSPSSIVSAEAFGSHTLTTGAVSITPSGIASAEAFGTAVVALSGFITPSGIASAEAFGSHTLTTGAVSITPSGIATAEAFSSHTVTIGAITLTPSGIASAEAFGSHTVSLGTAIITPSGIESGEAFGSLSVLLMLQFITVSGIASAEAFGSASVSTGLVAIYKFTLQVDGSETFTLQVDDEENFILRVGGLH